jgi:hypothetical protein
MRVRAYLQPLVVGLTAPVLTYMVLALLVPTGDARLILLAGSGWCGAVWACYFLGVHVRDLLRRPPRLHRGSPTRHA